MSRLLEPLGRVGRGLRSSPAVQGLLVALAVAVPPLVIEEDWHGRPMLDQPGHLWLIPALVAALGLLLGGAVSARRSVGTVRAGLLGAAIGLVSSAVLVTADLVRRAARHQSVPPGVARLLVEAALVSILLGALGAVAAALRASAAQPDLPPSPEPARKPTEVTGARQGTRPDRRPS